MYKKTRKVAKVVVENPNTKREVKESSQTIRSLMSQMTMSSMLQMLDTCRLPSAEGTTPAVIQETDDRSCQVGAAAPETREIATHTEAFTFDKEMKIVTRKQIEAVDTLEDFQHDKNLNWPEEVFRVRHVEGSPLSVQRDSDLVVWEESPKLSELYPKLADAHPELKEMTDAVGYLYETTKRVDMKGRKIEKEIIIVKIKTDATENYCLEHLRTMKTFMSRHGRKKISLYPPVEDVRGPIFHKMTEYVFGGETEMDCRVYYASQRRRGGPRRVLSETAKLTRSSWREKKGSRTPTSSRLSKKA